MLWKGLYVSFVTWICCITVCLNYYGEQLILTLDVFSSCCLGTCHTFLINSVFSDILWVMWSLSLPKKQKHRLLPFIETTFVNVTINVACIMVDAAWNFPAVMCTSPLNRGKLSTKISNKLINYSVTLIINNTFFTETQRKTYIHEQTRTIYFYSFSFKTTKTIPRKFLT